jgi:organic radical activating enzyme
MRQQFRVNEIFYSLQGEGRNTGRAAVFVRFAGCNLRCPFCDTEFDTYREMTAEEIIAEVDECRKDVSPCDAYSKPLLVLTGGEPTLQVDEAFVELLHQHGYEVAMESNGILPAPKNLDWLTVSPKGREVKAHPSPPEGRDVWIDNPKWREDCGERREEREERVERLPDEIKVVFDEDTPAKLSSILSSLEYLSKHPSLREGLGGLGLRSLPLLYLQPCDTGDAERNAHILHLCIEYIKQHPCWRLSLQTHKLTGIK